MSDSRFLVTIFTKIAGSKNKRLLLGLVASCIFVINIILVLRFLDDSTQTPSHSHLQYSHDSGLHLPKEHKRIQECKNTSFDSLSASAFKRMKTEECRSKLENFLCSLDSEVAWPVSQIENTCTAHFNKSATYSYVGCFKDSPRSRLLTGYKYNFAGHNNVKMCVQACLRAGYIYAGVEYGIECFCGNDLIGQFKSPLEEKHCESFACPNSDSYCGGYEAIALYLTGIKENLKTMPKFIPIPDTLKSEPDFNSVNILFVLQLNGRNARQVRRLIKLIYRPYHLYYVHVDSRQKYMYAEMKKVQTVLKKVGLNNFYVAKERRATIWGGSSLLEMFLNVIRWTLGTDDVKWRKWDYILNLSEADMPLLSMDELEYNLFRNMGMSFLSSHGYSTASFLKKQGFNYYFLECEQRMWRIASNRNYPHNLRLDGGSDWVVVHRDLAEFAVSTQHELPFQIRELFSRILLPLEGFFHTLALNSDFCTKVLYKNLRLTNWKRKQGCRCEMLKKIVDWCGCSPLAIQHTDGRFNVDKCQARSQFFGRKFDSLIDSQSISDAESQVLRFYGKYLSKVSTSLSFNSTWITVFHSDVDSEEPKNALYKIWAQSIFESATKHSSCAFDSLHEIYGFKADVNSAVSIGLVVNTSCMSTIELLLKQKSSYRVSSNHRIVVDGFEYQLNNVGFGTDLDYKEEIFRDVLSLVEQDTARISIIWHWNRIAMENVSSHNMTSPGVTVQLLSPHKLVATMQRVKPYDSINFAQFVEFDMSAMKNVSAPGLWTAKIFFANMELAEIEIPVFPDTANSNKLLPKDSQIIGDLSRNYFQVVDTCGSESFRNCKHASWSAQFPDEKSEIIGIYESKSGVLL